MVPVAQNAVQAINNLATVFADSIALLSAAITAIHFGSFTCGAAATTVVADVNVLANSVILLMPTNAAAGTLQGSVESLYISARTVGVGFTVATAAGTAAGGTETFEYIIVNPA